MSGRLWITPASPQAGEECWLWGDGFAPSASLAVQVDGGRTFLVGTDSNGHFGGLRLCQTTAQFHVDCTDGVTVTSLDVIPRPGVRDTPLDRLKSPTPLR